MEDSKVVLRRYHDDELQARVLAECAGPAASVAKVALAHGINANLVHKWRRRAAGKDKVPAAPVQASGEFVALSLTPLPPAPAPPAEPIRIELRRGATLVSIAWPAVAAGECTAWLRELLR